MLKTATHACRNFVFFLLDQLHINCATFYLVVTPSALEPIAGRNVNGAVQVKSCLAGADLLWGLCECNLWSEASDQLSNQPPPPPPSFSVNRVIYSPAAAQGQWWESGTRGSQNISTIARERWDHVQYNVSINSLEFVLFVVFESTQKQSSHNSWLRFSHERQCLLYSGLQCCDCKTEQWTSIRIAPLCQSRNPEELTRSVP